MTFLSLCRIDWKLAARGMLKESAVRFLLLLLLSAFFVAIVLSGGMNRFLSGQWSVTAILRLSVTPEEGRGIAKKAAGLPGVGGAVYKDPETAWKEFLAAYPGLDSLRTAGGNPLPGYVEIHMSPGRLDEADVRRVEGSLRPLPQVENVLTGGEAFFRLLKVKTWVNGLFRAAFGLLCALVFLVLYLQEKARSSVLSADFGFLRERGVPAGRIALSRALGAAAAGLLLSAAAAVAAVAGYVFLESRLAFLARIVGPAEELFGWPFLFALGTFLVASTLLHGGASLLGWRAARVARK